MYFLRDSHSGFAKITEGGILFPDGCGNKSWTREEDNGTYLYFKYVNGRVGMPPDVDERLTFQLIQNVKEVVSKVTFPESIGTLFTVQPIRSPNQLELLAAFHVNESIADRSALKWMRDVTQVFYGDIIMLNSFVKPYAVNGSAQVPAKPQTDSALPNVSQFWALRN